MVIMRKKVLFAFFALGLTALVSCNKQEPVDYMLDVSGEVAEAQYMLVLEGEDGFSSIDTRSGISSSSFELAEYDSDYKKSGTFTAILYSKTADSDWVEVENPGYEWSKSGATYFTESSSGNQNTVTATAKGSGKSIKCEGKVNGITVASQTVDINVDYTKAFSWGSVSSVNSGSTGSTTLSSTYKCSATVAPSDNNFLVGTSSSNLKSSVSVDFTGKSSVTIYYKFTGSSDLNADLTASNSDISKDASVQGIAPIVQEDRYYCSANFEVTFSGESKPHTLSLVLSNYPDGVYVKIPHNKIVNSYSITYSLGGFICNSKTGYQQIDFGGSTLPTGMVISTTNSGSGISNTVSKSGNWTETFMLRYQGVGPNYKVAFVDENNVPTTVSGYTCVDWLGIDENL